MNEDFVLHKVRWHIWRSDTKTHKISSQEQEGGKTDESIGIEHKPFKVSAIENAQPQNELKLRLRDK